MAENTKIEWAKHTALTDKSAGGGRLMQPITIHVPAVPVAQPRARAVSVGGHARVYDDNRHPVNSFKATVRMALKDVYKGEPLTGPLRCDCLFIMPRPKSMIWKTRPMPRAFHDKKPDLDNIWKATKDALKSLAWVDDSQVCQGLIEKTIAAGDEQPHAVITITRLESET